MTKIQFRQNMGILGLESTNILSDKIFEILDKNSDEIVIISKI